MHLSRYLAATLVFAITAAAVVVVIVVSTFTVSTVLVVLRKSRSLLSALPYFHSLPNVKLNFG